MPAMWRHPSERYLVDAGGRDYDLGRGWPETFQRRAEPGQKSGNLRDARASLLARRDVAHVARRQCGRPHTHETSSEAQVHAADAAGARMVNDPLPLVRALAKLSNANGTRPAYLVNPGLAAAAALWPRTLMTSCDRCSSRLPAGAHGLQRLTRQALQSVAPGMSLQRSIGRRRRDL